MTHYRTHPPSGDLNGAPRGPPGLSQPTLPRLPQPGVNRHRSHLGAMGSGVQKEDLENGSTFEVAEDLFPRVGKTPTVPICAGDGGLNVPVSRSWPNQQPLFSLRTVDMSKKIEKENEEYQREDVATKMSKVLFSDIQLEPETYAFRDEGDLKGVKLKSLADDIKVNGLITSLLVYDLGDGRCMLVDGHRRYGALQMNIDGSVHGFTPEMMVPVTVIEAKASELARLTWGVTSNVQRQSLSAEGRQRAAMSLHRLGMPSDEIARVFGVSSSTVGRDLALGSDEVMMGHVRLHHITGTDAATLVQAAQKSEATDVFHEAFGDWLAKTQATIESEQALRLANDEEGLSEAETWPQRYLESDQVKAWKNALEKKLPLTSPGFRFRALIKEQNGQLRLEIDGISKSIDKMSLAELAKISIRIADLADDLPRKIKEKHQAEQRKEETKTTGGEIGRSVRRQLVELGLADAIATTALDITGEVDIEEIEVIERLHQPHSEAGASVKPSADV